jgi:hypothetical protein
MVAEAAFRQWEKAPSDVSYLAMRRAMKKVPSLEEKYQAVIARHLLQDHHLEEAFALAHRSIARIEVDAPFHAAYGKASLLIEQEAYQAALESAVGLKERMVEVCQHAAQEELSGGAVLYAHNLLRIAFLHRQLDNPAGERAAWEDLEGFLKEKRRLSVLLLDSFQDQGVSLSHYMAERKRQLKAL